MQGILKLPSKGFVSNTERKACCPTDFNLNTGIKDMSEELHKMIKELEEQNEHTTILLLTTKHNSYSVAILRGD